MGVSEVLGEVLRTAEASGLGPAIDAAGNFASSTAVPRKQKRESVSFSNLLAGSDAEDDADNDSSLTGCTNMPNGNARKDELDENLTMPQIENKGGGALSGVSALVL